MHRLIILTYDFSPNNGGIARLCGEIRDQCIKTGTPYLVITPVMGPDEPNVVRISGSRGIVEWQIWRYLRKNLTDQDVVLTGTFHPDGLLAILAGAKNRYFLAHGAEFLPGKTWFRRTIFSCYRRWVLKKAKIIANSHYTAGLVRKCSQNADVVALPLGVDAERFMPTSPKQKDGLLHLCSISRLLKFKAQDFVIKTIAGLPGEYRNKVRLEIGGKGSYRLELERLVDELKLNDIVTFTGFVGDDELSDFYSRNDVFILCTREEPNLRNVEGFGLVFAEAQSCGTMCIGSNAGGIPDAVEEGNGGFLINQDDERQLRDIILSLINDPEIVKVQSAKAIERVRAKCTWKEYFNNLTKEMSLQ